MVSNAVIFCTITGIDIRPDPYWLLTAALVGIGGGLLGGLSLWALHGKAKGPLARGLFPGKTVKSLMTSEVVSVTPDMLLSELVEQVMLPRRLSFVPVVEDGVLLGHIDKAILSGIDPENWTGTRVDDVFVKLTRKACVPEDMPVEALLERIGDTGRRKFLVVGRGALRGVISLSDLIGVLRPETALPEPGQKALI